MNATTTATPIRPLFGLLVSLAMTQASRCQ
jgi:hypothetical protein